MVRLGRQLGDPQARQWELDRKQVGVVLLGVRPLRVDRRRRGPPGRGPVFQRALRRLPHAAPRRLPGLERPERESPLAFNILRHAPAVLVRGGHDGGPRLGAEQRVPRRRVRRMVGDAPARLRVQGQGLLLPPPSAKRQATASACPRASTTYPSAYTPAGLGKTGNIATSGSIRTAAIPARTGTTRGPRSRTRAGRARATSRPARTGAASRTDGTCSAGRGRSPTPARTATGSASTSAAAGRRRERTSGPGTTSGRPPRSGTPTPAASTRSAGGTCTASTPRTSPCSDWASRPA